MGKKKKKLTYAQIAEQLTKLYNKYDKNLQNATTDAEINASERMLNRVSNNINQLIVDNQNAAIESDMVADATNAPADSPNQSIGRRTEMMQAKKGGKVPKMQGGGSTPTKRYRVQIGARGKNIERIVSEAELNGIKRGAAYGGGSFKILGEVSDKEWADHLKAIEAQKKLQLETNSINEVNSMLSSLTPNVRNAMLEGYKNDPNYDIVNGRIVPKEIGANVGSSVTTGDNTIEPSVDPPVEGRLYDNITMKQINPYLEEAGMLSGLGNEFNPKNPEHVRKLQEGLLGGYTGPGADRMLSGTEGSYINKGGEFSVNNAGIDGRFGADTYAALKQFSELEKPALSNTVKHEPVELGDPLKVDLSDLTTIPTETNTAGGGGGDEGDKKEFAETALGKFTSQLPERLGDISKLNEYLHHQWAINNAMPPEKMGMQDPIWLNPNYNINPQLQAGRDRLNVIGKGLGANSTMRNNLRNNLTGLVANEQRNINQLYATKQNEENKIRNLQAMENAQTAEKNMQTDYDNRQSYRNFINDRSNARAQFATALAKDAQDLITQRTNRRSQMEQLEALLPWLNSEGILNRQYADDLLSKWLTGGV